MHIVDFSFHIIVPCFRDRDDVASQFETFIKWAPLSALSGQNLIENIY